jgi:hypothetical protein
MKQFATAIAITLLSFSASASVLNTFDGDDYEWLELTETVNMSRAQVAAELLDVNSDLYGYEYASRALVESLLLSYSAWDGLNGRHRNPGVVNGIQNFVDDFGALSSIPGDGVDSAYTVVDGPVTNADSYIRTSGLFGLESECGGASCLFDVFLYADASGTATMATQSSQYGWDSAGSFSPISGAHSTVGSLLVRSTVVPIPAAAWLFGSAFAGLGWLRRKQAV